MSDKKCSKCGDNLTGHEDESGTICRWCDTGWHSTDDAEPSEIDTMINNTTQHTGNTGNE